MEVERNNMEDIKYTYKIDKRPDSLGGGYRLRLLENGEEVGGGVFPLELVDELGKAESDARAYSDADSDAWEWLNTRPHWTDSEKLNGTLGLTCK